MRMGRCDMKIEKEVVFRRTILSTSNNGLYLLFNFNVQTQTYKHHTAVP